jgi:membrane fusion protein, multidrug efflux system
MSQPGEERPPTPEPAAPTPRSRRRLVIAMVGGVVVIAIVGAWLVHRVDVRVNHQPMSRVRPVGVVVAASMPYRETRRYVGAIDAWQEASVGPQYISAYVTSVAVRPGAVVKRGEVLATLDCSHPTAASRAAEAAARAVGDQQRATADEAARVRTLLDGGYVALNDVERKTAQSTAEAAQLAQSRAQVQAAAQSVDDCVMRAPFDGEIGTRSVDPGAFVGPGANIVSIVDRATERVVADAPEKDFSELAPGVPVRVELLATEAKLTATVSRRAPRADAKTRTVHFEIDIADPERTFPIDTTALVDVDVGKQLAATAIPIYAVTEQGAKATLFVVDAGVAHERTLSVLGERDGNIYFAPDALAAGTAVVTEGRALLSDGDRVASQPDRTPAASLAPSAGTTAARGGGYGRPL